MTIRAKRFTPEVLITAPRWSRIVPNDGASAVIYTRSTYSFEQQRRTSNLLVTFPQHQASVTLDETSRASNPVWLEPSRKGARGGAILFLREREQEKGVIDLMCFENVFEDSLQAPYVVGTFTGPVGSLKLTRVGFGYYGIAVSGRANPDGTLYNPHTVPKPKSTAKLYGSLFVRHWDEYVAPQRDAIFYAALLSHNNTDPQSRLFMTEPYNALKGTGLESPIPTFGGGDHFDISQNGLVFVARDPNLSPALHTKCNVYIVPLANFLETTPTIYTVKMDPFNGAKTSPRFNSDGSQIVFLSMRQDGYEADRNEIFVIQNMARPAWVTQYRASEAAKCNWDRSPGSICFSDNSKEFYMSADDEGITGLFRMPIDSHTAEAPTSVAIPGSVSSFQPLPGGHVAVNATNLVASALLFVTPGFKPSSEPFELLSMGASHNLYGLNPAQYSSRTYPSQGSINGHIQYWETRPFTFSKYKRYPVAVLVHGGPQSCWEDAWSTRWNPAVFAEQGYVVVCPNITGSTGFGQAFTDAITNDWGGQPYRDLEALFAHLQSVDYVDTDRAVALGASYGGYMMNWLQGQPLGRKFKALVCHDGAFCLKGELATDELYFVNHDFGGSWDPKRPSGWERWDPSNHTDKWNTPQLTIHSEKDYRLTMAEGLSAFNVLQSKGVESEFLTFEDENHFVQGEENSLRWHEVVLGFINRHVGLHVWERREGDIDEIRMDKDGRIEGKEGSGRIVELEREAVAS